MSLLAPTPATDPWALQRTLMSASGQHLPASPELNKGVILYAALNLEELSETLKGLCSALEVVIDVPELGAIQDVLNAVRERMFHASRATRELLANVPNEFRAPLASTDLLEMADGTSDTAVTNCGFALSLGIDGAACYREVVGSNLSKANPATGVIDKKPDGKWIKGPNFREPDLAKVLGRAGPQASCEPTPATASPASAYQMLSALRVEAAEFMESQARQPGESFYDPANLWSPRQAEAFNAALAAIHRELLCPDRLAPVLDRWLVDLGEWSRGVPAREALAQRFKEFQAAVLPVSAPGSSDDRWAEMARTPGLQERFSRLCVSGSAADYVALTEPQKALFEWYRKKLVE